MKFPWPGKSPEIPEELTGSEPVPEQRPERGGSVVPTGEGDHVHRPPNPRKEKAAPSTDKALIADLTLRNEIQRAQIHELMIAILDGRDATHWEETPLMIDPGIYRRAVQKAIDLNKDNFIAYAEDTTDG